MDVNGLPMWQIAGRAGFGLAETSVAPNAALGLHFKDDSGHARLAQEQAVPALGEDSTFARLIASSPSPIADPRGSFAWWNAAERRLDAAGFAPGSVELPLPSPDPPSPVSPGDFAFGDDDVIYAARDGALVMKDVRDRWPPVQVRRDGFRADLIAPAPGGGGWAFDRGGRRLARIRGVPLRFAGLRGGDPAGFAPARPNRNPPRLLPMARATIPARFDAVAMAGSQQGRLALLAWESGQDAAIFTLEEEGLALRCRLAGLAFPVSLAWIGEGEVAVLAARGAALAPQAFVYPMDLPLLPDAHLPPDGRIHPLIGARAAKFCNMLGPDPLYLVGDPVPESARPLHALSGGRYARDGAVLIGPIDSRAPGCVWHRLYVEAAVPSHGGIEISALAAESAATPVLPGEADAPYWSPHLVGPGAGTDAGGAAPRASWCADPSEVAFSPGLLACPRQPERAGLFTVLLQRGGRKVRRLAGRYLWLHVRLTGDSQSSPELAAIRVYANRFSYRDSYLPAFYREPLGGIDADAAGAATPHDFMDRLLGLFEGVLTETEGKIASSWLLTDAAAAPDAALPWLGGWIGLAPAAAESPIRLRQALLAAPYTAALNGTLGGLAAALEIATGGVFVSGGRLDHASRPPAPGTPAVARIGDAVLRTLMLGVDPAGTCAMLAGGAVTRGNIVLVEGYRLRRSFATILGADLEDEQDPLTLGLAPSGNSFVGDTLILGDEARAELLALYRPQIDSSPGDSRAVADFYARLAHQVLVLVRGVDDPSEIRRLTDVVEAAIPAHVEPRVHQARDPLIVGAASLIGVDSWLGDAPMLATARLGATIIGRGDVVAGSGRLDPRADGPVSPPPEAKADGPAQVWSGRGFTLSALRSTAASGRKVSRHIWTWD